MRNADEPELRAWRAVPVAESGALAKALAQGLDTPLAALRATMESLDLELRQRSAPGALPPRRFEGVLREVERLGKNVRELCALATPPVVRLQSCSLEEIVCAARAGLPAEQRARVVSARCEPGASVVVDGPLLAGCVLRLMENALEATDELVLVVARREDAEASFTVVDDAPSALCPGWEPAPFHTTKPNRLGLGLALTRRDVALLDGRLEFLSTPGGETCVRITIPSKEDVR
jgi:signal transduction histidine kinase